MVKMAVLLHRDHFERIPKKICITKIIRSMNLMTEGELVKIKDHLTLLENGMRKKV